MKHFLFLLFALPLVLVSCNPDEDDNELSGCMDPDADNFNPEATVEDCSCVYGLVGCGGASTVTFDGYTYELVAIGDQCWFAENLRTEHYANGDAIPGYLSDNEWDNTTEGAQAVYSNSASNLADYGRLYNWYAVDDARGLCPTDWHVPTDEEWMTLEMELGMSESDANSDGLRGTDQGTQMKTTYGWNGGGNGTNSSGFSALAGGCRNCFGSYYNEGDFGYFWSSSSVGAGAWIRGLSSGNTGVYRYDLYPPDGLSVRCVRDE